MEACIAALLQLPKPKPPPCFYSVLNPSLAEEVLVPLSGKNLIYTNLHISDATNPLDKLVSSGPPGLLAMMQKGHPLL